MARTKASVGAKVASGKSSKARAMAPPVNNYGSGSNGVWSSRQHSGGNPVCPRETPKWQKPITNFLIINTEAKYRNARPSGSNTATTENVIEKHVETKEVPQYCSPDDDVELQPLTGENSHKIDEYFSKKDEKPTDKETDDDHNMDIIRSDSEVSRKGSLKRDFSDISENEDGTNKKIKF